MIKPGQIIEITLTRPDMVLQYRNKGYEGKIGQKIQVKAEDLSHQLHKKIQYICDYCGAEFERIIYSNYRSKKKNDKDACVKCSRSKRAKETCLKTYGVDNPMKVKEIQLKNQESNINNFTNSSKYSCKYFEKGIPVSQGQKNLFDKLENFELNYKYQTYFIDLVKDNIAIEYDGKGHDMQVRMGKINQEDFDKKEQIKINEILKEFRLLKIIDKKDCFKNEITQKELEKIKDFINGSEKFQTIIIS